MKLYNKLTGKRIDLMVCDGDRTIIDYKGSRFGSSWDFVGHAYHEPEEWQKIASEFEEKIRNAANLEEKKSMFNLWVERDVGALKGFDPAIIHKKQIPYVAGVVEYFRSLTESRIQVQRAILSGGLDIIFERAKQELGFEHCVTNTLGIGEDGMFDGTIDLTVGFDDKMQYFEILVAQLSVTYSGVMVVGDSDNDVPLLDRVKREGGMAVAINPWNEKTAQSADVVVHDFFEIGNYTEIR